MKKFYDNYQDPQGDAIEGAFVTVFNSNGTLANLYSANSLSAAPLQNPVVTDRLGYYWFYIDDGRYSIRFNKEGYEELTLTDVEIADQDEAGVLDAKIAAAIARLGLTVIPGPAGQGVPEGGVGGQILKKLSNTDYDTVWVNESVASGFRPQVALTPVGGVATMNAGDSNNFLLRMTGDVVIANPVGFQPGDRIRLIFEQDSNGSHSISFGSQFQYSGNTTPAFSKSAGAVYRLDLDIISATRWIITPFIIQYNGDSTPPVVSPGGMSFKLVTAYPWDGTAPVVVAAGMDATTLAEARAAALAAPLGSKRAAYLAAVRAAFGATQALAIKRSGVTVQTINYTGQLTNVTFGPDLGLGLSAMQDASAQAVADLDTGDWTAVLSSGSRTITMDVGPSGSNKMLILSNDTAVGRGIIPTMSLLAQRVTDGLL